LSIKSQIESIVSNQALTDDQRREAIYDLKCSALHRAFRVLEGKTVVYDGRSFRLLRAQVRTINDTKCLELQVEVVRTSDNVTLLPATDIVRLVNPPILSSSGVEDLPTVVRELLLRLVP
jgi:hypothetical protein